MSLDAILNTAGSGLASVNAQLALVAQNVANSSTPGYATEVAAESNLTAGGAGYGVVTGPATQVTDASLQAAVNSQIGDVGGLQVSSDALAAVDAAQGTTGAGHDLASQLGALSNAFTNLDADPSNQTQQAQVVTAAGTLASGIRSQAAAYASAAQSAQDGLVSDVTALNAAVASIGSLSDQIIAGQAKGISTADLEAQRTVQEQTAAQLGGLRFLPQGNGDVTAVAGGLVVNTRAATGPFSIASATLGTAASPPPLLLSGTDVTAQVTGGSIGARLALRDTVLPQAQAGLDEFSATLATRLSNQGLSLFTDASGNGPVLGGTPVQAGYTGFSTVIEVNPAVVTNAALVRDGTQAVAAGTGGASAFTPNPAGGPAGSTTLIDRVLQYAFGSQAQSGTAQPAPNTTGLGSSGTNALPYSPGTTLASFATNLVSNQAQAASAAQNALSSSQAVQTSLQSKLGSETGVSVDAELSNMVELQNAYGANAKVITAAQSLYTELLDAVNPCSRRSLRARSGTRSLPAAPSRRSSTR